jgi:hypothetical protein
MGFSITRFVVIADKSSLRVSCPLPPSRISLPKPALIISSPSSPFTVSFPEAPSKISFPAPPEITSSPAPPLMRSLPFTTSQPHPFVLSVVLSLIFGIAGAFVGWGLSSLFQAIAVRRLLPDGKLKQRSIAARKLVSKLSTIFVVSWVREV